ncbi:MAG: hypothetical protein DI551_07555 [Micavibrio aeruginosavorus]|uniref:Uncharacterized protein n=1 Tax=Micavibrio aeruginosavorus TaxID=349221 RepID=A0A2W5MW15_9BACT|nr:MAG: hypothetical protein DI551_07555 [Micavibrio aeruginosavorus]
MAYDAITARFFALNNAMKRISLAVYYYDDIFGTDKQSLGGHISVAVQDAEKLAAAIEDTLGHAHFLNTAPNGDVKRTVYTMEAADVCYAVAEMTTKLKEIEQTNYVPEDFLGNTMTNKPREAYDRAYDEAIKICETGRMSAKLRGDQVPQISAALHYLVGKFPQKSVYAKGLEQAQDYERLCLKQGEEMRSMRDRLIMMKLD